MIIDGKFVFPFVLIGDFRMVVGEDKTKVLNIVKPNIVHFRELYGNILQENPQVVYKVQQGTLEVTLCGKSLLLFLRQELFCGGK